MQDLVCAWDSRKSFYGKAKVKVTNTDYENIKELYSYGTLVATINYNYIDYIITYKYLGKFSPTTTRHQKEFFRQHCLNDKEIKELFKKGELVKVVYM